MRDQEYKFIEYIKEKDLLSAGSVEHAILAADISREPIGEVLTKLGLLSEEKLVSFYASYCDIEIAGKDDFPREIRAVSDIEDQFFIASKVVILGYHKETVKLAITNPLNEFPKKLLSFVTGKKIDYLVAETSDVMEFYDSHNKRELKNVGLNQLGDKNTKLQHSYIDFVTFITVINISGDSHQTILETYIELSEDAFNEINDALINNEPKVLKGVIHSMKSSSYQIGATGLGDLAKKIEIFIAENNLKNIQPLIEEFIDECHGVNTKIQQYIDYNYKQ